VASGIGNSCAKGACLAGPSRNRRPDWVIYT